MTTNRDGYRIRSSGFAPRPTRGRLIRAAAAAVLAVLPTGVGSAETVKLNADAAAARAAAVSDVAAATGERLAAAQETVKAADAGMLPSVSVGAAVARRSSVPEFVLPLTLPGLPPLVLAPDITTTYGTSLLLKQALYSGGAINGLRRATRREGEASTAVRDQTLAEVRLAAKQAYWEAVRTAASIDVARAQEQRSGRLLEDTRALFGAGMAVNADVLAAKERVASARVGVIAAETAAANSLAALRSLLHIEPGDVVELADSLASPLPVVPGSAEELQRQALAARPELTASAAQIAALRAREEIAKSPSRPAVAAVAEWDYNRPNQRYFPQADQWKESWSVGLLASWTVFDGGRSRADTATSEFLQRAASRDRDDLERRILLEVENDRRNLEGALATVAAADASRAAADEREVAARERHAAGLAAMVEILDAQAQLASAEQQQVNARASCWVAAAVLARAIGQ